MLTVLSSPCANIAFSILQISGKLSMAKSALSSLQDACKTAALVNPKNYKKKKNGKVVPNINILGKLCPDNCNKRGRCVNGKCRCYRGYASSDCSVDKRKPPKIDGLQSKGMCDLRKRACLFASVYGLGFWEGHLNCHVQKARVCISVLYFLFVCLFIFCKSIRCNNRRQDIAKGPWNKQFDVQVHLFSGSDHTHGFKPVWFGTASVVMDHSLVMQSLSPLTRTQAQPFWITTKDADH